ncbi:hypothetical protein [Bacteriovorax stolpii]|uniref:hypothetical protein n=1 Tax=Bacteriovorax stolpii TaxID=960 RepID=UPI0011579126|nr:hypothetical protein [Bacteriovorax stolpii]
MKKLICLIALLFSTTQVMAEGNNGAGIVFGDPSGITFQHKINAQQFTDFYFAYTWDKEWVFIGDYKFHLPNLIQGSGPVVPYAGIGLFFKIEDKKHDDDVALGVRIPLGADWRIPNSPIVLFGELVPALRLIKSTDGDFQAGIGGRFFF